MPSHSDYSVGWICAITTEYVAARVFLDEEHDPPEYATPNDNNVYTLGKIGNHNVVIASLPDGEYGTSTAASVARDMLHSFPNIRIGLMVGIGGGAPSPKHDIRLGDIVVNMPYNGHGGVIQDEFGKNNALDQDHRPMRFLNQSPPLLRSAVGQLKSSYEINGHQIQEAIDGVLQKRPRLQRHYRRPNPDNDRLYKSKIVHPSDSNLSCTETCGNDKSTLVLREQRDRSQDDPEIHYGLIASGNQLIKDALFRDQLASEKGIMCFEMEAAGLMNHFPCLVVRGICDYSDTHKNKKWQGYAAMTAAAYTRDLLCQIPITKIEAEKKISDSISDLKKSVISVTDHMLDIRRDVLLSNLQYVAGAEYDFHANSNISKCHPGTRVDLLDQVQKWVHSQNEKPIFWLQGLAGTGKSTIACTVAERLDMNGNLGASFFFKRGEGDRGRGEYFFATLSRQLCQRIPLFGRCIQQAINVDPSITKRSMKKQFEKLILEPLKELSDGNIRTSKMVIVVDALDECNPEEDAKRIISLLSQTKSLLKFDLRFFVTSRPETHIRLGFGDIKNLHKDVALHRIPELVIERDIATYFRYELARIRDEYNKTTVDELHLSDWPTTEEFQTLVRMAAPMFIFAATVCRFLADTTASDPTERLAQILEHPVKTHIDKLAAIYGPVLDRLISGKSESEKNYVIGKFREIVGPIVLLAKPLSISSLALLLRITKNNIQNILRSLHSVFQVPSKSESPVRTFHLSFREFLVNNDSSAANKFWINKEETNKRLAINCLELLSRNNNLKYNICNLESWGVLKDTITQEAVNRSLSPAVQYACLYWIYHLEEGKLKIDDQHQVYNFLQEYFLHWLEALSLMGRIWASIRLILKLQALVDPINGIKLSEFLNDAKRFIFRFHSAINETPLQLYYSALLFAPQQSIIRKMFQKKYIDWVAHRPIMEYNWSPFLQTLKGHKHDVHSVAFSGNGHLIASGSDCEVSVWVTATGELRHKFEGYNNVSCIAFSSDSTLIASGSRSRGLKPGNSQTIRVWDTITGQLQQKPKVHNGGVNSIAFSSDGSRIASGSDDKTIRVWNTKTWELLYSLEHGEIVFYVAFAGDSNLITSVSRPLPPISTSTTGPVPIPAPSLWSGGAIKFWDTMNGTLQRTIKSTGRGFAFSGDGSHIASTSDDMIQIWKTESGVLQRIIHCHYFPSSIAFSKDGKLLASASYGKIFIWDATIGSIQQILTGNPSGIRSIAFSPDSRLLVSGSNDTTVKMWDITKQTTCQSLGSHNGLIQSIAFTVDSKLLASGSDFGTICIWDAEEGRIQHTLKDHVFDISALAFSPDSELLASASYKKITIWNAVKGTCQSTLMGHTGRVNSIIFSPNSALLALGSGDKTVKIWDIRDESLKHTLKSHAESIQCVSFSTDSKRIASGSTDKTIKIWNAANGSHEHTLDIGFIPKCLSFSMVDSHLLVEPGSLQISIGTSSCGSVTQSNEKSSLYTTYQPWIGFQDQPQTQVKAQVHHYSIDSEGTWIQRDGQNVLWLPPDYRPEVTETPWEVSPSRTRIGLGNYAGQVFIFDFKAE